MSSYQHVKEWRHNTKQKLIEALGSCCQICKYNKSNSELEFHHIDPNEKDFTFAKYMGSCVKPWKKLAEEASKCILLCANCHREVHDNTTALPDVFQKFDESLIVSHKQKPKDTPCKECGTLKDYKQNFCSNKCSTTHYSKLKLTKEQLEHYLIEYKGHLTNISKVLSVSDNAFKKRCLKEGLNPKDYRK